MKPFQTFKTVTRKFSSTSLDGSRGIESWLKSLFDQSNRDRISDRVREKHQDHFPYHFDQSSKSFDRSNIINFEFSLKKFHNLNFLLYQLYKTIFSKLKHHYYNLSIYIPTYTTYPCNNNIFLAWLVFYHA